MDLYRQSYQWTLLSTIFFFLLTPRSFLVFRESFLVIRIAKLFFLIFLRLTMEEWIFHQLDLSPTRWLPIETWKVYEVLAIVRVDSYTRTLEFCGYLTILRLQSVSWLKLLNVLVLHDFGFSVRTWICLNSYLHSSFLDGQVYGMYSAFVGINVGSKDRSTHITLLLPLFSFSFLSCSTYWLRMVIFCLSIPYLRMKLLALPLDLAVLPWYVINAILVGWVVLLCFVCFCHKFHLYAVFTSAND